MDTNISSHVFGTNLEKTVYENCNFGMKMITKLTLRTFSWSTPFVLAHFETT